MPTAQMARRETAYGQPVRPHRDDLVREHSQMVRKIAWHVHARMSQAIEVADLIQIGLIALLEASETFEDRGIAFAPYAAVRVRGAMIDELRRCSGSSRSASAGRRKLQAVRSSLENRHLRAVGDAEMAEAMELEPDAYHNLVRSSHGTRHEPLDELYSDHSMWFADTAEAADTRIEAAQFREQLAARIAELPPRDAMVLQLYFVEELNLAEIGRVMDVGPARICQIKRAALEKLREMLED